jgi:hypothetical protein
MKTRDALILPTLAALLTASGCSSTADYSPPPPGPDGGLDGAAGSSGGNSGNGGNSGTAGASTPTTSNCGDTSGPVDPTALIDNMEAGGYTILMEGGRNGSWWAGGDAVSPGAGIDPNGDAYSEVIPGGGRCGSLRALHVTGHGFTSWAQVSASMRYGSVDGGTAGLLPYDAHIRSGVIFWARIGDTSANKVRLSVSDKYSRPEGGICDDSASATTKTACYDTFGVDLLPLSQTWTQYRVPFGGLGQRGFGLPEMSGLDTTSIYTIQFDFYPNEIFDFWLDDISFY